MDVTCENPEDIKRRLLHVLASARVEFFQLQHTLKEFPIHEFPVHLCSSALALIRDHSVWSALVPIDDESLLNESYAIVGFHFAPDIPNSGFVGWLASEFKRQLGSGVFVVCGQNSSDGGVFDYWGIPFAVKSQAEQLILKLRDEGGALT